MKCLDDEYNTFYKTIKENWDRIAKPLDSLGKLEDLIARLGAIQKQELPSLTRTAVIIFSADNGIVEEGISQSDQSVTRICAENIAAEKTTVGIMAKQTGTEVYVYDVGINTDEELPGVINRKINRGTKNFLKEKAMSKEELDKAISFGIELAHEYKEKKYDAVCVGEMGIGNTTTSAAIASSLLKVEAEKVTGRGAGLSDSGLLKKIQVIDTAVKKYSLSDADAETVLQTAGGFDIACMCGLYIGAKQCGLPVILDGAISMVAALAAEKIDPGVIDFLLPSHKSREPLVERLCDVLKLSPVLDADMALGEGTGAVLMLGVLKTALAVYEDSVTFSNSRVAQYTRFK